VFLQNDFSVEEANRKNADATVLAAATITVALACGRRLLIHGGGGWLRYRTIAR
jgi:hypothetical protein